MPKFLGIKPFFHARAALRLTLSRGRKHMEWPDMSAFARVFRSAMPGMTIAETTAPGWCA